MSKHEKLAHYLATGMKDYAQGVEILKELGIDQNSIDFFNVEKPSALHKNLLKKKLGNYARVNKVKPELMKAKAPASKSKDGKKEQKKVQQSGAVTKEDSQDLKKEKPMIDTNPVIRFEDLPEEYQAKYKRAGELSNQEKTLHAELKALKDDDSAQERRAELSSDIVNCKKEVKELWAAIDQWWNDNKDKTKEQRIADAAAQSAIDKQKAIKKHRTYIQRNYGDEKKADEVQKRMKQLEDWGVDYSEDVKKATGHQETEE